MFKPPSYILYEILIFQVREQEKGIAFQKREDIKQRKSQQFSRLAEELKAEWEKAQIQKIQNLEKLYLASLRHMGEGHRQAKENVSELILSLMEAMWLCEIAFIEF